MKGGRKSFDRRGGGEFRSGDGVGRQREGKFRGVAGLVRSKVLDRGRNQRRRRNGLAGSATAGRQQQNREEKIENSKNLHGAYCDVKCRPFSIFHFPISGTT